MEALGASAYPSTLFLFWSEDEPPALDELRFRVADDGEPDEEPDQDHHTDWFWSQMFRHYQSDCPILVWACRRSEGLLFHSGAIRWRDAEEQRRALACEWLIGVETLLDPRAPHESYQRQLRFGLLLCPESPAVYDASSLRLRPGKAAELLAQSETPPRSAELFTTHAVGPAPDDSGCWVHSHGLRRASCPDIDLLAVPEDLCEAGALLIAGAAELLIAGGRPEAGRPFEVGPRLEVSWRPWRSVVEGRPGLLGGADDRRGAGNDHAGERIVLLAPRAPEGADPLSSRPLAALAALARPRGALLLPRAETARMARLARERWPIFGMLFARGSRDPGWSFFVKLAYSSPRAAAEHLWFRVEDIKPDRLRATLVNEPLELDVLEDGDESWHPLERLTDWLIRCPLGLFEPETADQLWEVGRVEEA